LSWQPEEAIFPNLKDIAFSAEKAIFPKVKRDALSGSQKKLHAMSSDMAT